MSKEDLGFCFVYGAISIAGLIVAWTYWYNEMYKNKK